MGKIITQVLTAIHTFTGNRLGWEHPLYADISPEDEKHITALEMWSKHDLRADIDAECCDCIYDPDEPGSWEMQVSACNKFGCPLHMYRSNLFIVRH